MSTPGFHSEWVTIEGHRILLECRSSFPDPKMHFDSRLAVEIVKNNSHDARVVRVFHDDKAGCSKIKIASCHKDDQMLERVVEGVFHTIFPGRVLYCDVVVVGVMSKEFDRPNLTEYLSLGAGVAADRSRNRDED